MSCINKQNMVGRELFVQLCQIYALPKDKMKMCQRGALSPKKVPML